MARPTGYKVPHNTSLVGDLECSKCNRTDLGYEQYHKDLRRTPGLYEPHTCEQCFSRAMLDRHRDDKRRYRADEPEKVRLNYRNWLLKKMYGITIEEFNQMLEAQENHCKICPSTTTGWHKDWHVDHDHKTGRNRGILCAKCNLLLGHAKDSITTLESAIAYLRSHEPPDLKKVLDGNPDD